MVVITGNCFEFLKTKKNKIDNYQFVASLHNRYPPQTSAGLQRVKIICVGIHFSFSDSGKMRYLQPKWHLAFNRFKITAFSNDRHYQIQEHLSFSFVFVVSLYIISPLLSKKLRYLQHIQYLELLSTQDNSQTNILTSFFYFSKWRKKK